MTRTGMARGRIAIVDRVDAVVAAMRINGLTGAHCLIVPEPWAIIEALKRPAIDRSIVRKWSDKLLELRLDSAGSTARVRVLVCRIENACGLEHDERCVVALLAQANEDSWRSYVMRLEAEAQGRLAEIDIPAPCSVET
jgi:hypothetical protein